MLISKNIVTFIFWKCTKFSQDDINTCAYVIIMNTVYQSFRPAGYVHTYLKSARTCRSRDSALYASCVGLLVDDRYLEARDLMVACCGLSGSTSQTVNAAVESLDNTSAARPGLDAYSRSAVSSSLMASPWLYMAGSSFSASWSSETIVTESNGTETARKFEKGWMSLP